MKSTKTVVVFLFAVLAAASVMGCNHAMTQKEYLEAQKQMEADREADYHQRRESRLKRETWDSFYNLFSTNYNLRNADVSKAEIDEMVTRYNKYKENTAKTTGKFDEKQGPYGKITYTASGESKADYASLSLPTEVQAKFSHKFDITIVGDFSNY